MPDAAADPVADLCRANAELVASRRAVLNALEDAVAARDALNDREAWLRGQRAALEAALGGAPLAVSLGRLARTATAALGDGTRAAFYLVSDEGAVLRHLVGMPAAYGELVDGLKIGPESLACGPVALNHTSEPAADPNPDPRWREWRWLAAQFGYRGCWSFPVVTAAGAPVGTLAFYWPQPKQATARELELADLLTHTAGIIISRHREAEARRQAEAALADELAAVSRLREMSDRLLAAADLPAALAEVLDAAVALHGADRGTVQVYDPATDELRYGATRGFDAAALAAVPAVHRDFHSTCAAALRTGERVLVPDVSADPRFAAHRATAAALGYRAAFSFPLTTRVGQFLGVLTVHFRGRREPTERDLRWADLYAPTAAHLIQRAKDEAALRAGGERLRLALSAARMGTWSWDVAADAHYRDASLNALLGLPAEDTTESFAGFLVRVHPDDRAAVRAAFDQSVRHGRPLSTEFRVVWPDGTVRWLRDQGDAIGTAGQARMTGACVDVTDLKEAEAAARRSEERLRLTVEGATDYAILTLSPGRALTSWSPGAEATFGWPAAEMLGRSGDELFTPEDRAAGAPEREAGQAVREGRAADERWHVRKDGGRFWASGVMNPLGPGGALGFVKVLRDLTERKRLADALRQARDDLERLVAERTAELAAALEALEGEMARRRDLARRLSTAQEDERRRVARDLHDTVGQLLTGLSLAFKAVEATAGLPPPAAAKLAGAQRIMSDLGRELHGLAVRLRPTALDDVGLESALAQLVSEWSSRSGVRADCHAGGLGPGRLPAEVETTVYRAVQEALTNVAKHAKAAQVSVVVTRPAGRVSVVVEDDGEGFDPDALPKGRFGLLGMRERVEQVGGTIDVESSPGAGTTVVVQIPTGGGPP